MAATTRQLVTVTADCLVCGATRQITGNRGAWDAWRAGEMTAQRAFGRLDPATRVWLTSGLCPACAPTHTAST